MSKPIKLDPEKRARIQEAIKKGKIGYQCCFCHELIARGEICAVVITVNWDSDAKKAWQQWFCHRECFTKSTGETVDVGKQ